MSVQGVLQAMAHLFGLRTTVQGSDKKKFVVAARTDRTGFPEGAAEHKVRLVSLLGGTSKCVFVVQLSAVGHVCMRHRLCDGGSHRSHRLS